MGVEAAGRPTTHFIESGVDSGHLDPDISAERYYEPGNPAHDWRWVLDELGLS